MVGHQVEDVGPADADLAEHFVFDALGKQVAVRAARGDQVETQFAQFFRDRQEQFLVAVANRNEDSPGRGQDRPGGRLRLGEGHAVIGVDAHDLARRTHLGPQHHLRRREFVEGQHGFLDGVIIDRRFPR